MATFPENPITGSPLIGTPTNPNPITVNVVPQAHQSAWTFHRVMLRVYAALAVPDGNDPNYPSDAGYTELEFSQPVASNDVVQFDVSSALQAVSDRYKPGSAPVTQNPYVKFRIEAWDEWMVDGTTHTTDAALLPGKVGTTLCYYYAFMGAFSDFERLVNGSDNRAAIDRWTRKPSSVPEVVFCGEEYIRPTDYHGTLGFDHADDVTGQFVSGAPEGGPKSNIYNIPATEGSYYIREGVIVYAITKPTDGYVVRFQNGLGCLESLHLRCLPKKTVPINTEKYVISRQETFGQFSRGLAVKSGDREEWRMSSGPLDEAWASWYIHEFLKAEACWIATTYHPTPNTSQVVWLPVHVIPEETVTLIDRQKTDAYEVQFTLQMDIEGSPMSALAI